MHNANSGFALSWHLATFKSFVCFGTFMKSKALRSPIALIAKPRNAIKTGN